MSGVSGDRIPSPDSELFVDLSRFSCRPLDSYSIDNISSAQSEVGHGLIKGAVTSSGLDLPNLLGRLPLWIFVLDGDFAANAKSIALHVPESK